MTLPVWFLVVTLFLPRIGLFAAWHQGWSFAIPQPLCGLTWFFLPRALVLMTVYAAQGFSPWFWLHVAFAVLTWLKYAFQAAANARKATHES